MEFKVTAPLLAALLLAGCASGPSAYERTMASPGAASAGKPGAPPPSVAAAGALDEEDQPVMIQHFSKAMESAPTGQTVTWTNPSGAAAQVSATRTFQKADGTYCREFSQTITEKGGAGSTTRGTACRLSDATWQIVG